MAHPGPTVIISSAVEVRTVSWNGTVAVHTVNTTVVDHPLRTSCCKRGSNKTPRTHAPASLCGLAGRRPSKVLGIHFYPSVSPCLFGSPIQSLSLPFWPLFPPFVAFSFTHTLSPIPLIPMPYPLKRNGHTGQTLPCATRSRPEAWKPFMSFAIIATQHGLCTTSFFYIWTRWNTKWKNGNWTTSADVVLPDRPVNRPRILKFEI